MKTVKCDNKIDFYKFLLMSRVNKEGMHPFYRNRDVSLNDFLSKQHNTDSFIYYANKFDFSETKEKTRSRLHHGHYAVKEHTLLQSVYNCRKIKKLKQLLHVAITVTIIGIIAGGIAAFTDVTDYKAYENTILIDRIDRLVRAVELDWGR